MDSSAGNASPPQAALHLGESLAHRACAHCRSQKVRCLPDQHNPDVCQRCARTGRPCVFTPLQKRRQRKRTDTRVAELEREMRMMRALLKEKNDAEHDSDGTNMKPSPPGPAPSAVAGSIASAQEVPQNQMETKSDSFLRSYHVSQTQNRGAAATTTHQMLLTAHQEPDIIDKGLLSIDLATSLLEAYRKQYFPLYPMVAIPPSMTAHDLRAQRPVLFLAIMAVVADREDNDLSTKLDQELVVTLASRSLVRAQKSLELVQVLLLSTVWYHPPQHSGQFKYYEYAHMAATMALDICIGNRPIPHKTRAARKSTASQAMLQSLTSASGSSSTWATQRTTGSEAQPASLECRRTFVSCYILCAVVALSLRRPNMLRVSSYVKECLDYLENAPDVIPSDYSLAAWARLCMIGEDISVALALDDPDNIASFADLRCQIMLKAFEKRLAAWLENTLDAHSNPALMITYYHIRLFAFEVALHVEHSPEDFRPPYEMGRIHESDEEVPSQLLAEAVAECIAAAHGVCNVVLACDSERVRTLPGFTYLRVCFASFVLTKLSLSAAFPNTQIGSVLDRSSLKIMQTLDRLVSHLKRMSGTQKSTVLALVLVLLMKVRGWAMHPEFRDDGQKSGPGDTEDSQIDRTSRPGFYGSRIVEHVSSVDSSPHSHNQANDSSSSKSPASLNQLATVPSTYQAMPASQMQLSTMQPPQAPHPPQMLSSYETQQSPSMGYMPGPQQANADPDLMQLWDEVSRSLPEGALNGLEDWMGMSLAPAPDGWGGYQSFDLGYGRPNPG